MTQTASTNEETTATQETNNNDNDGDSLRTLCSKIHAQVEAFLQEDVKTERLRRTQDRTRVSLDIIKEALQRYR